MGRVPDQVIDEIRTRCDIVDIVSSRIPLKRAGSAFKACCPFHKEKTPSFHVNPARQIFHCFGCGAGGDVFRFVMEYEKVDFPSALRMLADKAGIRLEFEEREENGTKGPSKEILLRLHAELARLYRKTLLTSPSAGAAREYLSRRKLDVPGSEVFEIGYAPDRRDVVLGWGAKQDLSPDILETAGLVVRTDSGFVDRFRNRVMFPIRDEQGRVVGFSGRVLREEDSPAKYLNSPETPIFRKSRILFALDRARRDIIDRRRAVLCEGQIDVLRCHLAGITHAVAAQGTAVTEDHARILKRYADEVVLMLDADRAGENAAIRSAEILLRAGLVPRCAWLPAGDDPDSLILRAGAEPVLEAIDRAESIIDFQFRVLESRGEMKSGSGRVRTARELVKTIGWASDAVLGEELLRQASLRMGTTLDALRAMARTAPRRTPPPGPADGEPASGGETEPGAGAEVPVEERALVEALIHVPCCRDLVAHYLPLAFLQHPVLRRMAKYLLGVEGRSGRPLSGLAPDDPVVCRLAAEMEMSSRWAHSEGTSGWETAAQDIVLSLWRREWQRRRQEALRAAGQADEAARTARMQDVAELTLQLKNALGRGWDEAVPLMDLER